MNHHKQIKTVVMLMCLFICIVASLPSASAETFIGSTNQTLYFLDSAQTTNNATAYGLADSYENSYTSLADSGAGNVTYGFRVWIIHSAGTLTELTSGTPTGNMTRAATGIGYQTSTWTPAATDLSMGTDALKVTIYVAFTGGNWTAKASYLTLQLMNPSILNQTWTFTLYTNATVGAGTDSNFIFGDTTYKSSITGINFEQGDQYDIMQTYLNTGDFIQFILYKYQQVLGGVGFYACLLIITFGPLYIKTRNIGVVVFTLVLFGGSGGLVWALAPAPLSFGLWILLVMGLAALLFKLAR